MHRLATVHAHDNQPTTNDVTTLPISISASFTDVKWALKNRYRYRQLSAFGDMLFQEKVYIFLFLVHNLLQ